MKTLEFLMCDKKAYKITCRDDDHGQRVLFADRAKILKGRRPTDFCDCDYIDLRVRRAPEFDKFSPGPITTRQYLEQGWFHWCARCEAMVYGDSDGIIIDKTGHVFCSRECLEKSLESYGDWNPETMHESMKVFIEAVRECLESLPAVEAA